MYQPLRADGSRTTIAQDKRSSRLDRSAQWRQFVTHHRKGLSLRHQRLGRLSLGLQRLRSVDREAGMQGTSRNSHFTQLGKHLILRCVGHPIKTLVFARAWRAQRLQGVDSLAVVETLSIRRGPGSKRVIHGICGGCGGSVIVKGGVSKAQEQMNVKMNIVC